MRLIREMHTYQERGKKNTEKVIIRFGGHEDRRMI